MVNQNFKLRASVSAIVAALLMGQTAIATAATKQPTTKATKTTHSSKKAKTSSTYKSTKATKPAANTTVASPAVAPVAQVAQADTQHNAEWDELTTHKSYIEAGIGGVTDSDWKFGQYNGLNGSGAYGIGNFDINGGGAYNSDDAARWRLTGKNIGLETREFTAEYKNQGKFKFDAGYNEIYRVGQGSYETPYLGAGGNQLNLPFNWQYPLNNNMRTLTPTDGLLFQGVELSTKRRRVDGGFGYFFNDQWELKASMRHEDKNGIQALGAPIVATRSVILPNPISQSTDQVNASINFTGEKAYGSFAYYGSIFHNDYNAVIFQNAYAAPAVGNPKYGQMSTMPDNQFHQFSVNGGYNFSTDTKFVGSGSYGRNWQDQSFLPYSTSTFVYPGQSNLNGGVDFKAVTAKLTHKATQDLALAASYKYDERENTTSVYTYRFPDVDTAGLGTNFRNNTPFSRRVQTGNLDADYTITKGHALKFGYEIQNIDRWCNGTWTSCVDTATTTENLGRIDYRGKITDRINTKVGYAYSNRSADNYNQDTAYLASFQQPQTTAQWNLYNSYLATGLPSWGPALPWPNRGVPYPYPNVFVNNNPITTMVTGGGNAQDINGLGRFNTAPRNRQSFNSLINYQVSDKWSLGLNGDYRYDDYYQSTFGLQSSRNWSLNLDSSFNFTEDFSGHVFYTFQNIQNKSTGMSYGNNANTGTTRAGSVIGGCVNNVLAVNNFAKTDPCRDWLSNMGNDINTIGLGLKNKGLFSGSLELAGDVLLSLAKTSVDVGGGQYVQSPTGTAANGPFYYIPAANMPDVNSQLYQFKFDAKYSFNKASAAHLTYLFQHLWSTDYVYTGQQPLGTPTGVMPTYQQAPVYSVHAFGLSYIYNF